MVVDRLQCEYTVNEVTVQNIMFAVGLTQIPLSTGSVMTFSPSYNCMEEKSDMS